MYKFVGTEIIARAKEAEDKAWREKQDKRLKELGIEPAKVYRVEGREDGRVFIEWSTEYETWQEAISEFQKYSADEVIQELEREKAEKGIVVEGSLEWFILTDY